MSATPVAGQVLGHYRIVEQIGAGGMGIVFRARDIQLDRDVALKTLPKLTLLSEPARKQFRREALSLAKITDPCVAMAFDFGHDDGVDYLVTEYVPGLSLDAKIGGRPLPEGEIFQLGKQLASGLEAAHREGVIHRDLKPNNVKVTPDGRLKILDFGLAYLFKVDSETTITASLTDTYSDAGTLPYMAPEQIKGQKPDARADVWSAGAVLYEMSTGKRPFGDLAGAALVGAILEQMPPLPRELNPKISEGLEHVIMRALQKDPKERYQSAGDLRIDLNNLMTGTMPIYPRPTPPAKWKRWALLGGAVIMSGVAAWLWRNYSPSESSTQRQKIMAVLPFESVSNDAPTNALGLGLTETVTAKLVQSADGGHLQLVSTRELIAQGVRTADQARREFGTDLVLEGSLQQNSSQIRITWSLVDPRTHTQLAANTMTGDAKDIFAIQDSLFNEIAEKLSAAVSPVRRASMPTSASARPEAYDLYLRGRGYLENYQNLDNLENAITQFQRAITVDKGYAPAYAAMGMAYTLGFQQMNRGKDWVDKAGERCREALAITPQLAEGHACLGNVYYSTGRYEDAAAEFQRSLDLDRNSDETLRLLAAAYQKLGNASAAEDAYRKAVSLRPNYWGVYSAFGSFYYNEAKYEQAAEMFRKATEAAPFNYRGYSNLGGTYIYTGQYKDAVEALKKSINLRPTGDAHGNLAAAYFYQHRFEEAADNFREALKIDDRDWLNWGSLGDTLGHIPSRQNEAAEAYRRAIGLANAQLEVNPHDRLALAVTADYYSLLGDQRRADERLAGALEIAPNDPEVLFRAAILYNHTGNIEKVLDCLRRAVEGGYSRIVIRDTPDFDHLHGDSRLRDLLPKQ